ncbi:PhnD/SsuA/transferrin family substrate-binding protein [Limibacillus sp. MBR-115]|uniref:phosphate/phosphite/phosphonate ABC transporter substrate-binding protein n=1 Tax=Limibacillus sp. MBR-115 TaxID=3156465 RepID=UPI003396D2B6
MNVVAGLTMYDLPEIAAATDHWWQGLSRHLRSAGFSNPPERLSRDLEPHVLWRLPDLLLAQCCGYDLQLGALPRPTFVATPCYDFPYCDGPRYCSVIVVPEGAPCGTLADLRGTRAAYNMEGSHSGYNALRAVVAPLAAEGRFFTKAIETGSHRNSLASLQRGEADVAAIDCITFGLLARHAPQSVAGIRVLTTSPLVPGLPYITCPAADQGRITALREALLGAVDDPSLAEPRAALGLRGFDAECQTEYLAIDAMVKSAESLGYSRLS